jgi:RNA ligase (TIGR02306 family)
MSTEPNVTETVEEDSSEPIRQLATVQRVTALTPIEGKDRIELAQILGWRCIVKKGELKVGDLVVYHEIDSLVPVARSAYSFLVRDLVDVDGEKYARVRRMRMGGVLSEGLALPLEDMELVGPLAEGDDMTSVLGVLKYQGKRRSSGGPNAQHVHVCTFPSFLPKTDEVRLQSCPGLLDELVEQHLGSCYMTPKADGCSMTIYRPRGDASGPLHVCSRNQELAREGTSAYHRVIEERRIDIPPGYAFQGELVGPGCNGNRERLSALAFRVFTVFYQTQLGLWEELPLTAMRHLVVDMGAETVPIIGIYRFDGGSQETIDKLVEAATLIGGEGIVIRPLIPCASLRLHGKRLSFKVLNPNYDEE